MEQMTSPVITTMCLPTDHPSIQQCIESKSAYAKAHGYTFLQGGSRYHDRKRHISWSKIPFLLDILKTLTEGTLVWQSEPDTYITTPTLRLEEHLVPLLPAYADILVSKDSFGKVTYGSMLLRNTAWLRDFLQRAYSLTQCVNHPEREDAAFNILRTTKPEDSSMIHVLDTPTLFNSYLCGLPGEPLWSPGNFVVRFIGVRDFSTIPSIIDQCLAGELPRISR